MRKRVAQNLLATLLGALVGGVVVFWALARIGGGPPASPTPTRSVLLEERPTASPAAPVTASSPSPAATSGRVTVDAIGVAFTLPEGYRIAVILNAYDAARSSGSPRFTMTKATPAQEEEYVTLIRNLQQQQVATEAPEFSPGKTITLARSTPSEQTFSQKLAKQKTTLTTERGLSVTRYQRVEGLFSYDVAFLTLRGGALAAVSMSYASGGEKPFDEEAYQSVLRTLEEL
ncbi:MAG: hypothetical protein G01um101438_76 [Parcubacteria group bacterium Gr01-1014_38]|nr:MAG: hypothetical protein G01um101438_76 [Parcubacteria group bacterium Gr01-1014_38]